MLFIQPLPVFCVTRTCWKYVGLTSFRGELKARPERGVIATIG